METELKLQNRFDFGGNAVAWGAMGEGPPLVLVHGTPFSSQVWRKLAPIFARRWRVFYFDLIGYGQSEMKEGQNVSLGAQNGLLAALLQEWMISEPEVLCHDFGGATALRAHYLNGIQFKSMTIFDAVAMAPWGSPFVAHVRHHETAFTDLPAYAHEALLCAYIQGAAATKLTNVAMEIYKSPWLGAVGQAAFYRQIAQMDQTYTDEIEPRYGPMPFPVKVLWGQEDKWIPIAQGRKLAANIARGRIVEVPGAGHLLQDDAPEAIVAAMGGF
jgi:pimeloyl-ACP methyl ester carboxylesterase